VGRCNGESVDSTHVNCMDGWLGWVGRCRLSIVEHNYVIIDGDGNVAMRSTAAVNCRLEFFKEISGSEQV